MPLFLYISRHSPENCAVFNEKARKAALAILDKHEELAGKHGVKVIGGWVDHPAHVVYIVYEAPTLEAYNKFGMEPETEAWNAFSTNETKIIITLEEIGNMMRQIE